MWKPRGDLPWHFNKHVFLSKTGVGEIKYTVEKFDQHGTVRNRQKEACVPQRRGQRQSEHGHCSSGI